MSFAVASAIALAALAGFLVKRMVLFDEFIAKEIVKTAHRLPHFHFGLLAWMDVGLNFGLLWKF